MEKWSDLLFQVVQKRKTETLGIIHRDLCGPMRVESKGKKKYFMTFIDDNTKWCEVRFLRNKSEAFKSFKALVEKQTNQKIKCLQSDNGTKYLSAELEEYLQQRNIREEKPNCP